jgi:hypothetical protein
VVIGLRSRRESQDVAGYFVADLVHDTQVSLASPARHWWIDRGLPSVDGWQMAHGGRKTGEAAGRGLVTYGP